MYKAYRYFCFFLLESLRLDKKLYTERMWSVLLESIDMYLERVLCHFFQLTDVTRQSKTGNKASNVFMGCGGSKKERVSQKETAEILALMDMTDDPGSASGSGLKSNLIILQRSFLFLVRVIVKIFFFKSVEVIFVWVISHVLWLVGLVKRWITINLMNSIEHGPLINLPFVAMFQDYQKYYKNLFLKNRGVFLNRGREHHYSLSNVAGESFFARNHINWSDVLMDRKLLDSNY